MMAKFAHSTTSTTTEAPDRGEPTVPLSPYIRPQRGAARKGEDKRKAADNSSDDGSDDPDEFKEHRSTASSKPKGKGKGHASTKRGRPSLSQTAVVVPSESSSRARQKAKEKPATPQKKLRKRASDSDDAGLAPASQTASPSKRLRTGDILSTPTKLLPRLPPVTPEPLGRTPSFLLRSLGFASPAGDYAPDAWDLSEIRKVGTPVWVRLTTEGDMCRNGVLWWPSQVTNADPLQVSVLHFRPSVDSTLRNVENPDEATILTYRNALHEPRFTPLTYALASFRVVYHKQWHHAVKALDADDDDWDLLSNSNPPSEEDEPQPSNSKDAAWTEWDKADAELRYEEAQLLVYELVMAQHMPGRRDHWPGKIVSVLPLRPRSKIPMFEIVLFDQRKCKLPQSRFFTTKDDGFYTCNFGQLKLPNPKKGKDTEDTLHRARSPRPRPRSPSPSLPAPSGPRFERLSIREQVRYIRSILQRIIMNDYLPARTRSDMFYEGRAQRAALQKQANYGPYRNAPEELVYEVRRCFLRNELYMVQDIRDEGEDVHVDAPRSERDDPSSPIDEDPPYVFPTSSAVTVALSQSSEFDIDVMSEDEDIKGRHTRHQDPDVYETLNDPPRPQGCAEYEALDVNLRSQYTMDVLVPEAVIQLIMFRRGLVSDCKRRPDAEENRLHLEASGFLNERAPFDWYQQAQEMRQAKQSTSQAHIAQVARDAPADRGVPTSGTFSRPKYSS